MAAEASGDDEEAVVGIEPGSDDGAKDCIAEEFQALVVRRSPLLMAT